MQAGRAVAFIGVLVGVGVGLLGLRQHGYGGDLPR